MSSILAERNSKRLTTITGYRVMDKFTRQVSQMLKENEMTGEINEKHELISSIADGLPICDCALTYEIIEGDDCIAITNNNDSECYYQINDSTVLENKTKLIIGKTSIYLVEKKGRPQMKIINTDNRHKKTEKHEIQPGRKYLLGRRPKDEQAVNIEILNDSKISKSHCEISFENEKWKVVDKDSTNGVYVHLKKGVETRIKWEQSLRMGKDLYLYFTSEVIQL